MAERVLLLTDPPAPRERQADPPGPWCQVFDCTAAARGQVAGTPLCPHHLGVATGPGTGGQQADPLTVGCPWCYEPHVPATRSVAFRVDGQPVGYLCPGCSSMAREMQADARGAW